MAAAKTEGKLIVAAFDERLAGGKAGARMLDNKSMIKLSAEARRNGDRIDINVKVSELNDPGADKKLIRWARGSPS